jgi:hypothetical protein
MRDIILLALLAAFLAGAFVVLEWDHPPRRAPIYLGKNYPTPQPRHTIGCWFDPEPRPLCQLGVKCPIYRKQLEDWKRQERSEP